MPSPLFDTRPFRSVSPDCHARGVRPRCAPTDLDRAPWHVDCGAIGQRNDRTDAGHGHHPPAHFIITSEVHHHVLQVDVFRHQGAPRRKHGIERARQRYPVAGQFAEPFFATSRMPFSACTRFRRVSSAVDSGPTEPDAHHCQRSLSAACPIPENRRTTESRTSFQSRRLFDPPS